jgi:hydrogenase-1 operon protein HyaF
MTGHSTGMAYPILSEIAQRLQTLVDQNQPASIDLRSLPLTQADRDELEEMLGRGEVSIRCELAGPTQIWETAYAGVWWIRHMGADERVATEEIAVTHIPDILLSQPDDVAEAALRIRRDLAAGFKPDHDHDIGTAGKTGLEAPHV